MTPLTEPLSVRDLKVRLIDAKKAVEYYDFALRKAVKERPQEAVGTCFIDGLRKDAQDALIQSARAYSKWLATKCLEAGPGAAADSGEAHIVQLLLELCDRLEKT